MTLYTCPHCKASSMYPDDLHGTTNCRSCGQPFELSRLNRATPGPLLGACLSVRSGLQRAKKSPAPIYVAGAIGALVVVWLALSLVGIIPDELRLLNRRFATPDDWKRVQQATGLVAVGAADTHGMIHFLQYGTAWAVSNDGFMVTNRHVVGVVPVGFPGTEVRLWVYVNKERIDADVVWSDAVSDIALIKADAYVRCRYKIGGHVAVDRLNSAVVAIGFQEMPTVVDSAVLETELASTTGTLSRVFQDRAGTWWLEHTAPLKSGSSGGPLLLDGSVAALNTGGTEGIYRALLVAPYREKIEQMIEEWRDREENKAG